MLPVRGTRAQGETAEAVRHIARVRDDGKATRTPVGRHTGSLQFAPLGSLGPRHLAGARAVITGPETNGPGGDGKRSASVQPTTVRPGQLVYPGVKGA